MKCAFVLIIACEKLIIFRLFVLRRSSRDPGILCRFFHVDLDRLYGCRATVINRDTDRHHAAVLCSFKD